MGMPGYRLDVGGKGQERALDNSKVSRGAGKCQHP